MKFKKIILLLFGVICIIGCVAICVSIFFIEVEEIIKLLNVISTILGVLGVSSLSFYINIKVGDTRILKNINLNKSSSNKIIGSVNDIYINKIENPSELIPILNRICTNLTILGRENIENIIKIVERDFKEELFNKTLSFDKDFILRYIMDGTFISDSDIQEIWAKLLTQSLKDSKSISKKTLSIVKDLRRDDALLFEKIINYCCEDGVLYKCLTKNNFTFLEISKLKDCGILKADSFIENTFTIKKYSETFIHNRNYILIIRNKGESDAIIKLDIDLLTQEGLEIKNALHKTISTSNLVLLGKTIKEINNNVEVAIHEILSFCDNGEIMYKTDIDLLV